MPERAFEPTG